MKKILIEKLIEMGYETQYIMQQINQFEKDSSIGLEQLPKNNIHISIFDKPTSNIQKKFLNINNLYSAIFVFEGELNKIVKYMPQFNNQLQLADYSLSKELCLICITKDNIIEILKYIPNINIKEKYLSKTYEDVFEKDRQNLTQDYIYALSANGRLTLEKAKEILYILVSEFIVDKILTENLNPRLKLYDDARLFAENITNYQYKYINKEKNKVETLYKKIVVKEKGNNVKIGQISNEPYLKLAEVNAVADFYLNKPSFVWLESNHIGKEELAIYTATSIYSSQTYKSWVLERTDLQLLEKAENLAQIFSKKVGYTVSKESVLKVLEKLNRELIILPESFIKNNINQPIDTVELLTYSFSVTTNPKEFEEQLYISLENYMSGRYLYKIVENLGDINTMVGRKLNYTNENNEQIQKQLTANFNMNSATAILQKETILIFEQLNYTNPNIEDKDCEILNIEKADLNILPIPGIEVIFFFPSKLDDTDEVKFYNDISNMEHEKRMAKVLISFINGDGEKIIDDEEKKGWIGENFIPDIPLKIVDKKGFIWQHSDNNRASILVKEEEKNEITLHYDKLMSKVKIQFVDEEGKKIKDEKDIIYQVGETINYQETADYIDDFGRHWKPKTLDKINQKVSEKEDENIVNMIYTKRCTPVTLSFVNESGQKIMRDKINYIQIGTKYKFSSDEEIVDDNGKVWICIEDCNEEKYIENDSNLNIILKCRPLMTKVEIKYLNTEKEEILPDNQVDVQVGETYIPSIIKNYQTEDGRKWVVNANQIKEFKIKNEENKIVIKYEPVLINTTIQYQDLEGKEIKNKEVIQRQVGSEWTPEPRRMLKDEKGNEWQLVVNEYPTIKIIESEKANVVTYIYQVAKADVTIIYMDLEGNQIKPEDTIVQQVGSAYIARPEPFMLDKENRKWKLNKVQPAMLKVKSLDNKIVLTYQPEKVNVVWRHIDTFGNMLKNDETHLIQIGEKYTPLVSETTIQKEGQIWKLLKIEPYETVISENAQQNIVNIVYIKVNE